MNSRDNRPLVNSIPMPQWLSDTEAAHTGKIMSGNEAKMRFVIDLATENVRRKTGGPFAAAIFDLAADRLVAVGVNVVVPSRQFWAHAEMIAFAHAQNLLDARSLAGHVLVSSCEPCAMCSGAVVWSGVEKLIYGAPRDMAEAVGFDEGYKGKNWREEFLKRNIRVIGPLPGDTAFAPFALYRQLNGSIY